MITKKFFKLWNEDSRLKTKISQCGYISDLRKLVNSTPENLKALLMNTGVNDIELEPDVNQIHSRYYEDQRLTSQSQNYSF